MNLAPAPRHFTHAHPTFAHDGARMIVCRCCKDALHPSEFRPDYFPGLAAACEEAYGGPCCTACMDEHVTCYATGVALRRDDAERDSDGEYYAKGILPLPSDDDFRGYTIGGA